LEFSDIEYLNKKGTLRKGQITYSTKCTLCHAHIWNCITTDHNLCVIEKRDNGEYHQHVHAVKSHIYNCDGVIGGASYSIGKDQFRDKEYIYDYGYRKQKVRAK